MRTTPWRRTTLHFSQRFLTEAWTFICLPETISNPAPGQVIGRQFHQYLVSGEDPDKVHPNFSGRMGQNSVPICQFYTKHRVWQILFYRAFNLNRLFFRHSAGSFHHLPDSVIQKKYSTEWRRLGQWYDIPGRRRVRDGGLRAATQRKGGETPPHLQPALTCFCRTCPRAPLRRARCSQTRFRENHGDRSYT